MPAPYRPARAKKSAGIVAQCFSLGRGSFLRPFRGAVLQHGACQRRGALFVRTIAVPALYPRRLVCMALVRVRAGHCAAAAHARLAATPRPARAATWGAARLQLHGARQRHGALFVRTIDVPALYPRKLVRMVLARVRASHRAAAAHARRAATPRPARAATWGAARLQRQQISGGSGWQCERGC